LLLRDQIVKVVEKYIIPQVSSLTGEIDEDHRKIRIGERVYFRGKFLGKVSTSRFSK
jgi:hypothetical protein